MLWHYRQRIYLVMCGGAKEWGSPSNGLELRGAGHGLWALAAIGIGHGRAKEAGTSRRRPKPVVSLAGRQGQGARAIPMSRWTTRLWTPRTRARPRGGARMSRQAGSRHGVQDPRPGGNSSMTQGRTILARRVRVRAKMARFCARDRESEVSEEEPPPSRANKATKRVAIVSYDEKPGIQASQRSTRVASHKRGSTRPSRGYRVTKRHGTMSLLAGIRLITGKVHALVQRPPTQREHIEFPNVSTAAFRPSTANQADPR